MLPDEDEVGLQIRDHGIGIGIDERDLPHLFSRGWRGAQARMHRAHGLGLAIARDLVEMQGGGLSLAAAPGAGRWPRCACRRPTPTPFSAHERDRMDILLIEDDPRVADFLTRGLTAEGYSVQRRACGRTGLDAAERFARDCHDRAGGGDPGPDAARHGRADPVPGAAPARARDAGADA